MMLLQIYGLLGHAGRFDMPLDDLEVEELEPGEEFLFNGRVYEIRSVYHLEETVTINVSLVVQHATA